MSPMKKAREAAAQALRNREITQREHDRIVKAAEREDREERIKAQAAKAAEAARRKDRQ